MQAQYKPVTISALPRNTRLINSKQTVSLEDDANKVMTDLTKIKPFTVDASSSIEFANTKMITCGVRLLFVVNTFNELNGLITASDILGEKPILHIQKHGGPREEILVQDVMTPFGKLMTLNMSDVNKSRVGNIVETMKDFARQHILVVDKHDDGKNEFVCGLFSTTQIGRQLGMEINLEPKANTFAEVENVLASSF